MKNNEQVFLKFKYYCIDEIQYNRNVEFEKTEDNTEENKVKIDLMTGLSDEDEGHVQLSIQIISYEEKRVLKLVFSGYFKVETNGYKNINKEELLRINGTAILYPYVRAIITSISSQDSLPPFILPTINTQIFSNKENK